MTAKVKIFRVFIAVSVLMAWAVLCSAQEKPRPKRPVAEPDEPADAFEFEPAPPAQPKFPPGKPQSGQPDGQRQPMFFRPPGAPGQGQPGFPGPQGKYPPGGMQGGMPGMMPGMRPGFQPGRPGEGPPKTEGGPFYNPEMARFDQAEAEVERKCAELAMKYRQVPAGERDAIGKELTELVNKHFDLRQERRESQLKKMEEELKRLREAIKRRSDARDQIVKQRLGELLGDEQELRF